LENTGYLFKILSITDRAMRTIVLSSIAVALDIRKRWPVNAASTPHKERSDLPGA
jgi:hypothetical protein